MGLFASFTRAAARVVRALRGRVDLVAPQPLFTQGRIGGELTPKQVSQILAMADQGQLYRLVDLFDEAVQKDCHLQAVLSTFRLSLQQLEVQVIPATDRRKDRKVAAFVEKMLSDFGTRVEVDGDLLDLPGLIGHMAGGYAYSFAVAEIIWSTVDGQVVPVGAAPVRPRRFAIDPDTQELRFWDAYGAIAWPGIQLRSTYPNRFIEFTPDVLGTGRAREGLMRPLIWAALFRNWGIRDWMLALQLAGKPWRIGEYEKNASDPDIASLYAALDNLANNGAAMLPETAKLKVEWPKATGSAGGEGLHQGMCLFMADEMSKAVLGSTLTTQQGRTGAMALGNVHNEVRRDRRDAAARAIAAVLRRQLIAPAIRWNFGPNVAVPQIRLVGLEDVDAVAMANVVEKIHGLVEIPVNWVRRLLRMPAPKPGEEIVGPVGAVAALPAPDGADNDNGGGRRARRMRVRTARSSKGYEPMREAA